VTGIVLVGVLCLAALVSAVFAYRRTLGRGGYEGTMIGAFRIASLLGVLFGLTVGLFTLFVVLAVHNLG
jgi:hypothetical protein